MPEEKKAVSLLISKSYLERLRKLAISPTEPMSRIILRLLFQKVEELEKDS